MFFKPYLSIASLASLLASASSKTRQILVQLETLFFYLKIRNMLTLHAGITSLLNVGKYLILSQNFHFPLHKPIAKMYKKCIFLLFQ